MIMHRTIGYNHKTQSSSALSHKAHTFATFFALLDGCKEVPVSNDTFTSLYALTVVGAERVTLRDALDPLSGCGVLNCGLSAYIM